MDKVMFEILDFKNGDIITRIETGNNGKGKEYIGLIYTFRKLQKGFIHLVRGIHARDWYAPIIKFDVNNYFLGWDYVDRPPMVTDSIDCLKRKLQFAVNKQDWNTAHLLQELIEDL